jgi:hypothetical protein
VPLGVPWVSPGCLLGVSWVLLGAPGCFLGASWVLLGASWVLLGICDIWIYGYMDIIWIYGYMDIWFYDIWLYGYMGRVRYKGQGRGVSRNCNQPVRMTTPRPTRPCHSSLLGFSECVAAHHVLLSGQWVHHVDSHPVHKFTYQNTCAFWKAVFRNQLSQICIDGIYWQTLHLISSHVGE